MRVVTEELRRWWAHLNLNLFDAKLMPPIFEIREMASLGQWNAQARLLTLNEALIRQASWGEVMEVLKHEMAHQYVSEVVGVVEAPHGPVFQEICRNRGIYGAARRTAEAAGEPRIQRRVQKLLSLAQSSNANEAQAAASAAHRLLRKYNIEHRQAGLPYDWRHLGEVRSRIAKHEQILMGLLTRFYFVEGLWVPSYDARRAKRGKVFEIVGLASNLEMASYVYEFVLRHCQMEWRRYQTSTQAPSRARLQFLEGMVLGFRETLLAQERRDEAEGLVWMGDAELKEEVTRRYPRTRRGRRMSVQQGHAHGEGRKRGREVRVRKPIAKKGRSRHLLGKAKTPPGAA